MDATRVVMMLQSSSMEQAPGFKDFEPICRFTKFRSFLVVSVKNKQIKKN
jgi:hypothetical protein